MSEEKDTTQKDSVKNEENSTSAENVAEKNTAADSASLENKESDKKPVDNKKAAKGKTKAPVTNIISPSEVKPGMIIKLWQKIKETNPKGEIKERLQYFEGTVLARKSGNEAGATITVRKISNGVGVEKIFPLALPTIEKIELLQKVKTRRAKLYFLRDKYKKRLKKEPIA